MDFYWAWEETTLSPEAVAIGVQGNLIYGYRRDGNCYSGDFVILADDLVAGFFENEFDLGGQFPDDNDFVLPFDSGSILTIELR